MIAFKNWLMTQELLKEKHNIEEDNSDPFNHFYINGGDLEDAFIAGMQFQEELTKEIGE
jgi:hypothetical protein